MEQVIQQKKKEVVRDLEHEIVTTIAAFMNREGGILIVGYDDDSKTILGIERDYSTFSDRQNWDGWRQHLTNLLTKMMVHTDILNIIPKPVTLNGKTLAHITVKRAPHEVFVKIDNDSQLFLRFFNNIRE